MPRVPRSHSSPVPASRQSSRSPGPRWPARSPGPPAHRPRLGSARRLPGDRVGHRFGHPVGRVHRDPKTASRLGEDEAEHSDAQFVVGRSGWPSVAITNGISEMWVIRWRSDPSRTAGRPLRGQHRGGTDAEDAEERTSSARSHGRRAGRSGTGPRAEVDVPRASPAGPHRIGVGVDDRLGLVGRARREHDPERQQRLEWGGPASPRRRRTGRRSYSRPGWGRRRRPPTVAGHRHPCSAGRARAPSSVTAAG